MALVSAKEMVEKALSNNDFDADDEEIEGGE